MTTNCPPLPATGSPSLPLIAIAAALVLGGTALIALRPRRAVTTFMLALLGAGALTLMAPATTSAAGNCQPSTTTAAPATTAPAATTPTTAPATPTTGAPATTQPPATTTTTTTTVVETTDPPAPTGAITGGYLFNGVRFVDDPASCERVQVTGPAVGLTVTLSGTAEDGSTVTQSTQVDGNGQYSFLNIPLGTYSVSATPPDAPREDRQCSPGEFRSVSAWSVTTPEGGTYGGVVVSTDNLIADQNDFVATNGSGGMGM